MVLRPEGSHYEPIDWDEAFALIAEHLNELASPDEAVFYTSGKTSNEAAFVYQLFARAFGTNNLPDCSNMCHESTSVALAEVIGIGKGSVTLDDIHHADLIVIAGQNPGTNHPRMLSALEEAKKNGAKIIAVNPLREAGLVRFKNPQTPRGVIGRGTELADLHLPIRVNGDLALFQAIGALLLEWDAVDRDFIERAHQSASRSTPRTSRRSTGTRSPGATGLTRDQIEQAAAMFRDSARTVTCWAMGLTQHRNSVATIKEIVNVAFLQGNIGKPGAGLCPVRGHSNVQGDRTMGIWERPKPEFLDALREEFGFEPPREHGFDTVEAVKALDDGRAKVFFAMGGNFVSAMSDTDVTEEAMRRADLTVHVSTKLNRSHVVNGRTALILPALGRSEKDLTGGREQRVTVEDSMCAVHASKGPLEPASEHLRSEVDIVCSLALATLPDQATSRGRPSAPTTPRSGAGSPGWCPAVRRTTRRSTSRAASPCRTRRATRGPSPPLGQGDLHRQRDRGARRPRGAPAAADAAHARPVQHHDLRPRRPLPRDQERATRGVRAPRRHRGPRLARRRHRRPGEHLAGRLRAGRRRFRVVAYDQPRGCAAAYYPETNPLVPLDSKAEGSNTPTSKSVIVRLEKPGGRRTGVIKAGAGARPATSGRPDPSTRAEAVAYGAPGPQSDMSNPERDPDEVECRGQPPAASR